MMTFKRIKKHFLYLLGWYSLPIIYCIIIKDMPSFGILWGWGGIFTVLAFIKAHIYDYEYRKKFREIEHDRYVEWENKGLKDDFAAIFMFRIDKAFKRNKKDWDLIKEHEEDERIAPYAKRVNEMAHFAMVSAAALMLYPLACAVIVAIAFTLLGVEYH